MANDPSHPSYPSQGAKVAVNPIILSLFGVIFDSHFPQGGRSIHKSACSYQIKDFAVLPETRSCPSVSPALPRSCRRAVISRSDGHSVVKEQKRSRYTETPISETTTSLKKVCLCNGSC